MEQSVEALQQRIERLTIRSRRQGVGLGALSLVVVGGCLTAAYGPTPDVVRAQRFEAIDENGSVLAVLASKWDWGTPALALLNDNGEAFAFLTRADSHHIASTEADKLVWLHLETEDPASHNYGVTSVFATPQGGGVSISRSEDEYVSLGIRSGEMALRLGRGENPALAELSAMDSSSTIRLRDGQGNSLFSAP